MSYNINFKVKIDGTDKYISVGDCDANITWNVREIIRKSTGLEWKNEENNGLCVDVIPKIALGKLELLNHPQKYKQYESPNGWGTISGVVQFFGRVIECWEDFIRFKEEEIINNIYFFIV